MEEKDLGYKVPILLGVLAILNLIDWLYIMNRNENTGGRK